MKYLILIFGVAIVLVGVLGTLSPARFRHQLGAVQKKIRFHTAVLLRFVLGAILLLTADELRFTFAMQVLGGFSIAAGFGVLLMGQERLNRLVDWWLGRPDLLLRVSTALAGVFGLFIIYVTL